MDDLNPEAPLTVSQWADQKRVLTAASAESGKWHTDRTPYLREIMDSFSDPHVEEITVRSGTQVGKTEFILNCLGYVIDYEPAPTMVVLPRDEDTRGWAVKRARPMILASPDLRQHITGKEDDLAGKLYQLDRMFIKFAGANSPADLASDPCRFVLFDEVDKYPKFSGREADPVKLGIERTRTFWNKKIIKVSTPTTNQGYITREYDKSDQRRFYVPCPHCGAYQPLVFRREEGPGAGQLCWPTEGTADQIRAGRLAWYECGACHGRIDEPQKRDMLRRGVWCPQGCTVPSSGQVEGLPGVTGHRGYHLSSLYSPWVSWSQIAAEFLEAKDYPALLMNFVNSVLGEPWIERTEQTRESHLKDRLGAHDLGEVASGVLLITAGVDVQKDHFYFAIRGWGIGEESWLIRYGRCESFEDLDHVLLDTQYPGAGSAHGVRLVCIDSGARTNEVYAYCRKKREKLRPVKGYDHILAAPYRVTTLDKDANGRQIPGGLGLWTLDTNYYKDKLSRLIHTQPGDPGEWHLPVTVDQDYLDQMTSEHKVVERDKRTGRVSEAWQPITQHRANHYWDCEVYALLAADMLKAYLLRGPGEVTTYVPRPPNQWVRPKQEEAKRRGGGWIKR